MTYTELKAKPGQYIWDEASTRFVGRLNLDGTEDKRFSKTGLCSLLNNIIETTGYVPKDPQLYAERLATHKKTQYLVKGYGLVVKCYDLTAEMWVAKAAELLDIEGSGIADILQYISTSKATEHKAKIATLALIFGKELKAKKLADLTEVTEFELRLQAERSEKAKQKAALEDVSKLEQWLLKAFRDKRTVYRVALSTFEVGNVNPEDKWIVCNVALRWCLDNPSMKHAVAKRCYMELGTLLKGVRAADIGDYAEKYILANWSKRDVTLYHEISDYLIGKIGTKEEYLAKKRELGIY